MALRASVNRHIPCEAGQTKSLSYTLVQRTHKLKAEYSHLTGPEIGQLHASLGQAAITFPHEETMLVYTADTPIEPAARWGKTRVLIHEATFLDPATAQARGQLPRHSVLQDVLEMAADAQPEVLILTHFSTRYSQDEITEEIKRLATNLNLSFPIHAVLPGETRRDVLRQLAVYQGSSEERNSLAAVAPPNI
jgi:ribonuclease Z